jgi:hypothetical protein
MFGEFRWIDISRGTPALAAAVIKRAGLPFCTLNDIFSHYFDTCVWLELGGGN